MSTPTDKPSDYYNFQNPNILVKLGKQPKFIHRLGQFDAIGIGKRPYASGTPSVGVLHVPVYEDSYLINGDDGAEVTARYLANPPENDPSTKYYQEYVQKYGREPRKVASVHATSDRDSFVLCLPADSICYGCGNQNTYKYSWEVEIAGTGNEDKEYWRSEDAQKKFVQTAKAVVKSFQLSFGDKWKETIPPLQKAVLAPNGEVVTPGWTQHREIPYAAYTKEGRFIKWAQYPENLNYGQHGDIHPEFPFDLFFAIVRAEIAKY